jgi:hypothetical protein
MKHAPLTPRRRIAFLCAVAWLVFSLCVVGYASRFGGGTPFLRWPFALTILWTLVSALAAAAVVVESLRRGVRRWSAWSDSQHLRAAAILALICLLVQWASLFAAS